jgi:hypothetical protein
VIPVKRWIKRLPLLRKYFAVREGPHSPLVSVDEVQRREAQVFGTGPTVPGVDLNVEAQLLLLDDLSAFYGEMPFSEEKTDGLRYYFANEMYSYGDAITLYGMIRHLGPKKIVEIGSGFSSCVTLDTNTLFFAGAIDCVFVEPAPERFLSLLEPDELDSIRLLRSGVQDVNMVLFRELEANDILFVDSSHVVKTGSDVDYILKEVLPNLKTGVWVHFHDIFFPFEYPREWVYQGRSWNEVYFLRSFLQYNNAFSVQFFSDYLAQFHREQLVSKMPLCARNTGANLWLRKDR